jgi:hypothetical protein
VDFVAISCETGIMLSPGFPTSYASKSIRKRKKEIMGDD